MSITTALLVAVIACAGFVPAEAELKFTKAKRHFSATNRWGQPIYIYELAKDDADGETRHSMYARYNGLLEFAERQKAKAVTLKQMRDHERVFSLFPKRDGLGGCFNPGTLAESRVPKLNNWLKHLLEIENVTLDDFKTVEVRNSDPACRKSNELQGQNQDILKAHCKSWMMDDNISNEDTVSLSASDGHVSDVESDHCGSDSGSSDIGHAHAHSTSTCSSFMDSPSDFQQQQLIKRWASSLQEHVKEIGVLKKQEKIDRQKNAIADILRNASHYQRVRIVEDGKKIRFVQNLADEIAKTFRHPDYFHTLVAELEYHALNDHVVPSTTVVDDACQPFIQEFGVELILRMAEHEPNQYILQQFAYKFVPLTKASQSLFRPRFEGYLENNTHFTNWEKDNLRYQIFDEVDDDFVTQSDGLRISFIEAEDNNAPFKGVWALGEEYQAQYPAL